MKNRCDRCMGDEAYEKYHDELWGVPVYDDQQLFEFLILEGAQAGLSWKTILKKRGGYQEAFFTFDVRKCASMTDEYMQRLKENTGIVRNKLKIASVKKNALVYLEIQKERESFSNYLRHRTNNEILENSRASIKDVPATTELSDVISKDLKKRGMNFVGSTIVYAYLQAVGVVDDHLNSCWKKKTLG